MRGMADRPPVTRRQRIRMIVSASVIIASALVFGPWLMWETWKWRGKIGQLQFGLVITMPIVVAAYGAFLLWYALRQRPKK